MPEPMINIRLNKMTRRQVKALAGMAEMSMTEYITYLIQKDVESLTPDEKRALDLLLKRSPDLPTKNTKKG